MVSADAGDQLALGCEDGTVRLFEVKPRSLPHSWIPLHPPSLRMLAMGALFDVGDVCALFEVSVRAGVRRLTGLLNSPGWRPRCFALSLILLPHAELTCQSVSRSDLTLKLSISRQRHLSQSSRAATPASATIAHHCEPSCRPNPFRCVGSPRVPVVWRLRWHDKEVSHDSTAGLLYLD